VKLFVGAILVLWLGSLIFVAREIWRVGLQPTPAGIGLGVWLALGIVGLVALWRLYARLDRDE